MRLVLGVLVIWFLLNLNFGHICKHVIEIANLGSVKMLKMRLYMSSFGDLLKSSQHSELNALP